MYKRQLWSFSWGQSLLQTGLSTGGNVIDLPPVYAPMIAKVGILTCNYCKWKLSRHVFDSHPVMWRDRLASEYCYREEEHHDQ